MSLNLLCTPGLRTVVHHKVVDGGPSEISGIAIAIQRWVLESRDAWHKRTEQSIAVDAARVEADSSQDDSVGDFRLLHDGRVCGIRTKRETDNGYLLCLDLPCVLSRADERGELLEDCFRGEDGGFESVQPGIVYQSVVLGNNQGSYLDDAPQPKRS